MANEKVYVGKAGAQELYRRMKELLNNFGGYVKAEGTGADGHPNVANPSTKNIYLVKIPDAPLPDQYKEWIYSVINEVGTWECVGNTTMLENAWKQWSEDHGSSGEDGSVYVGQDNVLDRINAFAIGHGNTSSITDSTDYSGTDIMLLGTGNTAVNAANAYQLGRDNTVSGNNLADAAHPVQLALNLGNDNIVTSEGVNLGKSNAAYAFGVNIGQENEARYASYSIGNSVYSELGSIAIGNNDTDGGGLDGTVIALQETGSSNYNIAQKIHRVAWPFWEFAIPKQFGENDYRWVKCIRNVNDMHWFCYINEELNQYLVTNRTKSTDGTFTGYFDNGVFIESSNPEHNVKPYMRITSVTNYQDASVSVTFYASVDEHNQVKSTPDHVRYEGGAIQTLPEGGTILTGEEYSVIDAGSVLNTSDMKQNVYVEPNGSHATKESAVAFSYEVYGYFNDNDEFIPWSILNSGESHDWTWSTICNVPSRFSNAQYSPGAEIDYNRPTSEAKYNSIMIGGAQSVTGSSIGISISRKSAVKQLDEEGNPVSIDVRTKNQVSMYTLNQETGEISWVSETAYYLANRDSSQADDLSYEISINEPPIHTITGASIGWISNAINAKGASSIRYGSVGIGTGDLTVDSGAFAFGENTTSRTGSFTFGKNIVAENGAYAFGCNLDAQNGGFAIGRYAHAATGGVSIGTRSESEEVFNRSHLANGTIVLYRNPDNNYVPVTGNFSGKPGYSISVVEAYTNITYNDVTYDYIVIQSSDDYAYKDGVQTSIHSGDVPAIVNSNSHPDKYWRLCYTDPATQESTYSFVRYYASSEIQVARQLKPYLNIRCKVFKKPGSDDIYVYAAGFGYDSYSTYYDDIDLNSCEFDVSATFTPEQIGLEDYQIAPGAFGGGIAIGDAHASGGAVALSSNGQYNLDEQTRRIIPTVTTTTQYPTDLPTSLGIRIADDKKVYADGDSVALGSAGVTATGRSVSIGSASVSAYNASMALGMSGITADESSLALGLSTSIATLNSVAIGCRGNRASYHAFAIGDNNISESSSFIYGNTNNANCGSVAIGQYNYAAHGSGVFGYSSTAQRDSWIFGKFSSAINYATVIGTQNHASNYSVGVGFENNTYDFSNAFGHRNTAKSYATCIGVSNTGNGLSSAIGFNNTVSNKSFVAGFFNTVDLDAIAIGNSNTAAGWSIVLGESNDSGATRGAHATIIGHNNKATSDKETVNWASNLSYSTSSYVPTYANAPYGITQQIYTPDELQNNSGVITKIAFTADGASNVSRNLKIYLGSTDKESFTWAPYYDNEWPGSNDWISLNGQTLVYNGSFTFQPGKNEINLSTPFTLPANTNLVVTVIDTTGSTSSYMWFTTLMNAKRGCTLCHPSSTAIDTSDLTQYMAGEYPYYTGGVPNYKTVMSFTIGSTTVSTDDIGGLTGEISTNSIIMGEKNTSNHWNSMLFGVGNTSLAPLPADIPDSEHPYDHDDGFVLAIGRENVVGRNYDIAIGYKSVANGGENIAIGNSKAVGYRNIAMVNSDIIGISNIGLMESSLTTTLPVMYYGEGKNVRNVLLHGKLNHSGPELIENIVINSGADLTIKQSCSGNVFYNVDRRATSGYYDDHDVYHYYDTDISLSIDAYNIVDNVFWGMYVNEGGSITCQESANKNFVINSMPVITRARTLTNNLFLDSVVTLDNVSDILSNTVIHGRITGTNCATRLIGNHIGTECCLNIDNNTSDALVQNFLENGSSLTAYTEDPIVNRCDGSGNVMFGASGKGIRGCFCMGQGGLDARNGGRQYTKQNFADSITNMSMLGNEYNVTQSSLMTANFGPNPIMSTTYSVVAGIGNTAYGIHSSTVIGKSNVVGYHSNQGYYEYPSSDHGMFYADIFGESNMVFANGTFVMNAVHGGRNHVFTNVMTDSQIFGRENKIAERPVPAVMSCAQVKALQEQYEADSTIQLPTYIKMSDSGTIYEYNGSGMYRGTESVTADYIYKIDKENKYTGEPYGINLNRVWNDENDLDPNTSNYASEIHRLHVFGQKNWVHSYVMDYTVFGSANEITNSIAQSDLYHPFGISNGFVQGNNNAVSNGSNIVCMGNGNVSTGHNSVAIGSQLISSQWQTVVGKYNEAVSGPSRVIEEYKTTSTYGLGEVVWHEDGYYECTVPVQVAGSWDSTKWTATNPESDKAIFIIGNGYSETDSTDWQDETKIHRSNAMEVYADGTVKARQFVTDNDATLVEGDGIHISEANNQVTVAVKQSLANLETFLTANPQPQSGTYMLGSVNGAWAWIQVSTTTIGA